MIQTKRRRPKLGQHFLSDPNYRRRIIAKLELHEGDDILELGSGAGAMTPLLAERARKVVAVELDEGLIRQMEGSMGKSPNVEIVHGDILQLDIAAICRKHRLANLYVFGNIPYYITSPIIHHLLASGGAIRGMALLMQKEVAQRVTANPGSRDYGYLTVAVRLAAEARVALSVPPEAFSPAPDVQSALVVFRMIRPNPLPEPQREHFLEFTMRCFAHKRKNLLNNLVAVFPRTKVETSLAVVNLAPSVRAEQVSFEDLIRLFHALR